MCRYVAAVMNFEARVALSWRTNCRICKDDLKPLTVVCSRRQHGLGFAEGPKAASLRDNVPKGCATVADVETGLPSFKSRQEHCRKVAEERGNGAVAWLLLFIETRPSLE